MPSTFPLLSLSVAPHLLRGIFGSRLTTLLKVSLCDTPNHGGVYGGVSRQGDPSERFGSRTAHGGTSGIPPSGSDLARLTVVLLSRPEDGRSHYLGDDRLFVFGLRSRIQGTGSKAHDPRSRAHAPRSRAHDPRSRVQGTGQRIQDPGHMIQDPGHKV